MKKFLSVALSLVMLFTATTFNGSCAFDGSSNGVPQNNVERRQRPNNRRSANRPSRESKKSGEGFGAILSKAANFVSENAAVLAAGAGVGAIGLVGMNAARNKKLDAAELKENWNDPNKSAAQKYFDAIKILLFGDKTRKNLQTLENKENKLQKRVDDLTKQRGTTEEEKNDANAKLREANTAKENANKDVNAIENGGEDKEGKKVKGLEALKQDEKTAQKALKNATNARKYAEKNLKAAEEKRDKADKAAEKAKKAYDVKKDKFEKIENALNNKDNGANGKLDAAKEEYKNACDKVSRWEYNKETGKCEHKEPCGPNFNRNENGNCVCDTKKFELTTDGQCLPKCGENFVRGEGNKCVCNDGYELVKGKCLPKCGENQERNKGDCICIKDYISVNDQCVEKVICGANEVYDEATNKCNCAKGFVNVNGQCVKKATCGANEVYNASTNKCDCASGYKEVNGKCELVPTCDAKTQVYDEATNKCNCAEGFVNVNGQCVKKATCGANEVYDASTNKCDCASGYKEVNGKCELVPTCDAKTQVYDEATNKCNCAEGFVNVNDQCVKKATCGANEVYDEATNKCNCAKDFVNVNDQCVKKATCGENEVYDASTNRCDCASGYKEVNGKCELVPTCDAKTQVYDEATNKCNCAKGFVNVNDQCVKKATCGENEVYNAGDNTCTCPTDKGFEKDANGGCSCPNGTILVFEGGKAKCVEKSNDASNF